MQRYCFVLLLAIALLCNSRLGGQPVPLLHYTVENGLPSNTVYNTLADSKGYLWLATDKGIARFDGSKFTAYTTSDGLTDNEVFSFAEDKWGRLWIFTFKGTLCYYKDGSFHSAENTPWLKQQAAKGPFFGWLREKDSSLICVSGDSKRILYIKGEKIKSYSLNKLKTILPDNDRIADIDKTSASTFRIWFPRRYLDIDTSLNLLADSSFSEKRYPCYSLRERYWRKEKGIYNSSGQLIHSLRDGEASLLTALRIVDGRNVLMGLSAHFLINDVVLLNDVYVTCISQDIFGNYWVSTKSDGVYYLSKDLLQLRKFANVYEGKVLAAEIFNRQLVYLTDRGDFYSLSQDRINCLYRNPDYVNPKKNQFYNFSYLIWDSLSYVKFSDHATTLLNLHDGTPELRKMPRFFPEDENRYIKGTLKVGEYLYLSSISLLGRLKYRDLVSGNRFPEFTRLISSKNDWVNRITSRTINKKQQSVWISRTDGVFKIQDTTVQKQQAFGNIIFRQFGFWNNYLVGRTDNNKLLVCSGYNGPVSVDTIPDQNCIWDYIYAIDENHAIISTNNYYRLLTLYPVAEGQKPHYRINIVENPFLPQQAEYIKADSQYCYFFKDGSVTRLATALLFSPTHPPATVLSSFKARDKIYPVSQHIVIPYSESKNINISFDNISFLSKDITCEYSISENSRDEWVRITGNEINLNTPGFGDYTIKIRSKTFSSAYSAPAILKLTVRRPYWATWWFITLAALTLVTLIVGFVYLITWRKLRKRHKEHEAEMKYQQSEYKALNALMNPHFIFNSLNNIQGLINKDEKRTANEYLVIFSDLIRQNMHNISKGFISLQQELNLVENYLTLEKLRFKDFIHYKIEVEESIETDDILIPPLMIQPLVENAVKHGLLPKQSTESFVSIKVYEQAESLYIEIEDNGIGLTKSLQSKSRLYESFGLSNLKKRTDHLRKIQKQEIEIEVKEITKLNEVTGTKAIIKMSMI